MKKVALLSVLIGLSFRTYGQSKTTYDSLPKNEITASFLPVLVLFSGYDPIGRYGFYNFGYRRFLNNKKIFRASISFAPAWSFGSMGQTFVRTQGDSINIFKSSYTRVMQ